MTSVTVVRTVNKNGIVLISVHSLNQQKCSSTDIPRYFVPATFYRWFFMLQILVPMVKLGKYISVNMLYSLFFFMHGLLLIFKNNCNFFRVCTRTRADTVYSLRYSSRLYYYSQSYSTCCSHFIVCWSYCRRSRTRLVKFFRN